MKKELKFIFGLTDENENIFFVEVNKRCFFVLESEDKDELEDEELKKVLIIDDEDVEYIKKHTKNGKKIFVLRSKNGK